MQIINNYESKENKGSIKNFSMRKKVLLIIAALIIACIISFFSIINSYEYGKFENEILLCRSQGGTITTTILLDSIDNEKITSDGIFKIGYGKRKLTGKEAYYAYEVNSKEVIEMPEEITQKKDILEENAQPYAEFVINGYGIQEIRLYIPQNAEIQSFIP